MKPTLYSTQTFPTSIDYPSGLFSMEVLEIIAAHSGSVLRFLIVSDDRSEVNAFIPLFVSTSKGIKFFLSPPPRMTIPYAPMIIEGYQKLKSERKQIEFLERISTQLKAISSSFTRLSLPHEIPDVRAFSWQGFQIEVRYTYELEIANTDQCFKRFSSTTRNLVKRALKDALIDFQTTTDSTVVQILLNKVLKTYKDSGSNISATIEFSLELFKAWQNTEQALCRVCFDADGKIIAGYILLVDDEKAWNWHVYVDKQSSLKGLGELLYWDMIQKAQLKGAQKLDLVGANTPAIASFKSKFAPKLIPFYVVSKPNKLVSFLLAIRGLF